MTAHSAPVTDLAGVGPAMARRLASTGVRTMGDLAAMEADDLRGRLGLPGPPAARVDGWIREARIRTESAPAPGDDRQMADRRRRSFLVKLELGDDASAVRTTVESVLTGATLDREGWTPGDVTAFIATDAGITGTVPPPPRAAVTHGRGAAPRASGTVEDLGVIMGGRPGTVRVRFATESGGAEISGWHADLRARRLGADAPEVIGSLHGAGSPPVEAVIDGEVAGLALAPHRLSLTLTATRGAAGDPVVLRVLAQERAPDPETVSAGPPPTSSPRDRFRPSAWRGSPRG